MKLKIIILLSFLVWGDNCLIHAQTKKYRFETQVYSRTVYNINNFKQNVENAIAGINVQFPNTINQNWGINQSIHFGRNKGFSLGLIAEVGPTTMQINMIPSKSLPIGEGVERFSVKANLINWGINYSNSFEYRRFRLSIGLGLIFSSAYNIESNLKSGTSHSGSMAYRYYFDDDAVSNSFYSGNLYLDWNGYKTRSGQSTYNIGRSYLFNVLMSTKQPLINNTKIFGFVGLDLQRNVDRMMPLKHYIEEIDFSTGNAILTNRTLLGAYYLKSLQLGFQIGLTYR